MLHEAKQESVGIQASPPADWSTERKQAYFDWAACVVAGLRGIHPGLESVFDRVYAGRPLMADSIIFTASWEPGHWCGAAL